MLFIRLADKIEWETLWICFEKKALSIDVRSKVRNYLQDCAGFGAACKAHPATDIEISVGGCNAENDPKDK